MTAVRLDLADGIGRIVLSRPPVNALNRDAQEQLRRCAVRADDRVDVAVVVLTGDGGEPPAVTCMNDVVDDGEAVVVVGLVGSEPFDLAGFPGRAGRDHVVPGGDRQRGGGWSNRVEHLRS